jgi:hypothetical protein
MCELGEMTSDAQLLESTSHSHSQLPVGTIEDIPPGSTYDNVIVVGFSAAFAWTKRVQECPDDLGRALGEEQSIE